MKNKLKFAAIVLLLVILILVSSILYNNLGDVESQTILGTNPAPETQEPTETIQSAESQSNSNTDETEESQYPAPDFTVYDLAGEAHTLSDYFGKPIVLNFWASWCGPCKSEMPAFQAAYEQYGDDVHFLLVNMTDGARETVETASKYIEDSGYTFPVFYDTDYSASYSYNVTSLPTSLFIDKDGYMVAYAMTAMPEDILFQGIDMILPQE